MSRVYIIASSADRDVAEELEQFLKMRGSLVRVECGDRLYPIAMPGEKTVALWSLQVRMSSKQIMFTNRAIDGLVGGGLVLVKLDHHMVPRGLSDVDSIDIHFAPSRPLKFQEVKRALDAIPRETDGSPSRAIAPPTSSGPMPRMTPGIADELEAASEAPSGVIDAPKVFVSYAVKNADEVYPLVSSIESLGHDVWIDKQKLKGGDNWAGSIVRGLKAAETFCLMCSAEAFDSDNVRREVYLADKYKKPMLPIRLDQAMMPEDIEFFLIDRQYVDLTDLSAAARLERVKAAFQT